MPSIRNLLRSSLKILQSPISNSLSGRTSFTPYETGGKLEKLRSDKSGIHFEGTVVSFGNYPITGFHVYILDRKFIISEFSIDFKNRFHFILAEDGKKFKNCLVQVVPLVIGQEARPFHQIYEPIVPQPSQEESNAVGSGNFLENSLNILDILVGAGNLRPTNTVLEVGCGLGRIAYSLGYFLNPSTLYEGFDIDLKLIEQARKFVGSYFSNFNFQHVNVFNGHYNREGIENPSEFYFPYADNTFDFVYLTSVFTHMMPEDISHYLKEVNRVLKRGGTCLLTCFLLNKESSVLMKLFGSAFNFKYLTKNCYTIDPLDPESAVAYRQEDFLSFITQADLKVNAIHGGSWCGRRKNYLSVQDVVVLTKG